MSRPRRSSASGRPRSPTSGSCRTPRRRAPRHRAEDGASRDRTGDLLLAKQALSHLSYGPAGLRVASRKMAYDEDLANRIRELIGAESDLVEKKMFGGLAFLIGGNMAVAASGQGGLMVRVEPEETDALVAKPHARRFEMRGREMDGWLRVDDDGLKTKRGLEPWVKVGAAYARSLPAK